MVYEKVQKSSESPQSQSKQSRLAVPSHTAQAKADSQLPQTQQLTDRQEFQQHQHEATILGLQAKYGTITPQGQERLTVIQAKMNSFWQQQQDNTQRYGRNLLEIPHLLASPGATKAQPLIQPKLTIGQPGDKYEQEADRVAAQVVNLINAPTSQQTEPSPALQRQEEPEAEIQAKLSISDIQRREAIGGGEASTELESAINSKRGGGQPLDAGLQQSMGQAMGADFSEVKVHTDSQSDQLSKSIQAKAFTTGKDIFFAQGEYNPSTTEGKKLIIHEATHVMQQNGGAVQLKVQKQRAKPSQQPDLKQSRIRSERYSHQLNRANQVGDSAPVAAQQKIGKAEMVQLTPLTNQIESGSQQANEQQDVSEATHSHDIPAVVHFIWIGKQPSADAVKNIQTWVQSARNTNWKIYLWTDKRYGAPTSFSTLIGHWPSGVTNKNIPDTIDERLKEDYERALNKKAFNMASDLARYSILHDMGGVYADVDIGLGTVSLANLTPQNNFSAGEIPLFGPGLRDKQALDTIVSPEWELTLRERMNIAILKLNNSGQFGNHFIVAKPKDQLIERIIIACKEKLKKVQNDDIESGNAMMLTGPSIVLQEVNKYLEENRIVPQEHGTELSLMNPMLSKIFTGLDWLTPESEAQLHR